MKTKEIDVSVELYGDGTLRDVSPFESTYDLKAKLVIEIPEQKIEITESQFKPIMDYFTVSEDKHVVKIVKEKLGFR